MRELLRLIGIIVIISLGFFLFIKLLRPHAPLSPAKYLDIEEHNQVILEEFYPELADSLSN